jgi:hypothetical protein
MPRKKVFHTFREARKVGPYSEMPMLPEEAHIQVFLSRNDRPQPFYLICEKDSLLILASGSGQAEFKMTAVRDFALSPGDHVYVPAGAPHRFVPAGESVTLRYKAREAGLEGVAWYCTGCDAEIYREVWSTAERLSQDEYLAVTTRFNDDETRRRCGGCGAIHPPIDLSAFPWEAAAQAIRNG